LAARVAAQLQRHPDHLVFATRASAIIDQIADELPAPLRATYLLNKWCVRDELAASMVNGVLYDAHGAQRRTSLREWCRTFRTIDELTQWPIYRAFRERDADQIAEASARDAVLRWLGKQLAATPRLRDRMAIRSWLSLWWIPRGTLVLHYHVLPDHTLLFRIAHGHIDAVKLRIGRAHLTMRSKDVVESAADLGALAEHLGVAAALRQFPALDRLVVVPHDVIADLPFAAMMVNGAPLCQLVAVSQIDRLGQLRRGRGAPPTGRFLSVAISSYRGSGLHDLSGTESEAAAVVEALGSNDRPVVGEDATVDHVLANLPRASLFHAAAHGRFESGDPADSGIVLRARGGGFRTLTLAIRLDEQVNVRTLDTEVHDPEVLAPCGGERGFADRLVHAPPAQVANRPDHPQRDMHGIPRMQKRPLLVW
jgi:hypothetical protein